MKPLGNKVIVKPAQEAQATASGIVLPSTAMGPIGRGEVVAVGSGARTMSGDLIPMEVKVGDIALYPRKQGQEIMGATSEDKFIIIYETDLLCIL